MLVERLKAGGGAKRVAIFTHQRPDPDALGSQAAMGWILRELGASEIFLMQFADVPQQYRFLLAPPPSPMWQVAMWEGNLDVDTIIVVDTCAYSQLEPAAAFLKKQKEKVIVLDHHLSRDDVGATICADTKAAACVEVVWEIAKAADIKMSEGLAKALFAGLVSDTGWFRFDSVTERTHRMAAELTPFVNNAAMYEKLQQNETRPKLGLMERALASLRWGENDRIACMTLRQQDFTETGANQSQTEYLVDMPMIVGSVEIVILLTEMPDSRIRGSLRSKRQADVNKICRQFDGGGHAKAAGCRLNGPIETARERVMRAVEEELAEEK